MGYALRDSCELVQLFDVDLGDAVAKDVAMESEQLIIGTRGKTTLVPKYARVPCEATQELVRKFTLGLVPDC